MPTVLIVDDDRELSGLLTQYLEAEGFQALSRTGGEEALALIAGGGIDIVTLDIMMPRLNGIEVLRRIRRMCDLPVVMLTARGDDVDRISGLDLGADDYLAKPCSPGELAARLRAILRRTRGAAPGAAPLRRGALELDTARRVASWNDRALQLTGTEFTLLEVLATGQGQPISREELSRQGLGRPIAPYDRAIDVHISSIRQKLGPLPDGRSPIGSLRGVG